jgi:hypothetical protein
MDELDLAKRDMTDVYGKRTFAVRVYRQRGEWHGVIFENRTPFGHWLTPAADPATCFAAAVAFIAAMVDSAVGCSTTHG